MKKAAKIVTLLLTMVMVLSLCGCGGSSAKKLYGTWGLDYDMGEMLSKEMGSEYADFKSSFNMTLCFEFSEDGTFRMFVDGESFKKNFESWLSDFSAYITEVMYGQFESMGYTREEADAMVMESAGCSIDEYVQKLAAASMDADAVMAEMETKGTFEIKGDKLYMAEEGEEIDIASYDIFTIDGNTLTLEEPEGADSEEIAPGLEYPLVFHRMQ